MFLGVSENGTTVVSQSPSQGDRFELWDGIEGHLDPSIPAHVEENLGSLGSFGMPNTFIPFCMQSIRPIVLPH